MPIHDLGYRHWEDAPVSASLRWWVIAQAGIRLAWKSPWLRRLAVIAWFPALYMGLAFFIYEQSVSHPEMRVMALSFFRRFAGGQLSELYAAASQVDPAEGRHQVWGWLLLLFFRHPQGVLMALVVGLIAPPLIAHDIRSRAVLLYFSRPISVTDYLLGKMVVVWAYLAMITTAPALALYTFGVLLSPDLSVLQYTWDFPLRIVAASAVLMLPTTAVALAFSSLTSRTYHAGFAWFALWMFGFVSYYFLRTTMGDDFDPRWSLLSMHHMLGTVQTWVFDLDTDSSLLAPSASLIVLFSVVALAVLLRQVRWQLRR